jgi:hypothetical protein
MQFQNISLELYQYYAFALCLIFVFSLNVSSKIHSISFQNMSTNSKKFLEIMWYNLQHSLLFHFTITGREEMKSRNTRYLLNNNFLASFGILRYPSHTPTVTYASFCWNVYFYSKKRYCCLVRKDIIRDSTHKKGQNFNIFAGKYVVYV